jgi:PTS system fructose-specific IIC component
MKLSRYLSEDLIKMEMTTVIEEPEVNTSPEKWMLKSKELILSELVDLLEQGGRIGNKTKLLLDFFNREKKASTAIGHGVAVPHIRSLQAKEFMMAFARSTRGYSFDAMDNNPVHLFFVMAAPPYDDTLYLKVFKALAEILQYESLREELMAISSPGEVIRVVRSME